MDASNSLGNLRMLNWWTILSVILSISRIYKINVFELNTFKLNTFIYLKWRANFENVLVSNSTCIKYIHMCMYSSYTCTLYSYSSECVYHACKWCIVRIRNYIVFICCSYKMNIFTYESIYYLYIVHIGMYIKIIYYSYVFVYYSYYSFVARIKWAYVHFATFTNLFILCVDEYKMNNVNNAMTT